MPNFTDDWKRLSSQYAEARERFEMTSSVIKAHREAYATPSISELENNRTARSSLRLATQRLYDFLAQAEADASD